MFLRSNARAAGLAYRGAALQATYVAVFRGAEIVAVAAHCWNGMILVQAPERLNDVVRAAVAASGRPVTGLSGPADQVANARRALGLARIPVAKDGVERLYSLQLADLAVPPLLAAGEVACRHPVGHELDLLTRWRIAFSREALGLAWTAALDDDARTAIERHQHDGTQWVLLAGGTPVAYSAFNARLPDAVQVGGVWTPPEHRRRGYGRAVVAGSLLEARAAGVARAVLFADDTAAQRAYLAIGFRPLGYYGLTLFREAVTQ